ncbi:MAG: rhodanese-like domain-containing protein [Pseudomonadota bacterium]
MEKLPEFIANHPGLFAAFGVVVGMLIWTTMQTSGGRRLTPMEATGKMNRDDAVIVDVRSETEFQNGHVIGAVNMPLSQIEAASGKLKKHKQKPLITICANGQSAGNAARKLTAAGFEDVYAVSGGVAAWEGANLPLTRKS